MNSMYKDKLVGIYAPASYGHRIYQLVGLKIDKNLLIFSIQLKISQIIGMISILIGTKTKLRKQP
ncbi:MAG: hypothetical protein DF198_0090 [Streptococcus phage VS-2018a]|uniref:Uncharacterized protein n=1 Tax=Streptococcus phage VS-2018a TaxID=2184051 RepID=A0A3G6K5W5_9CAUD|nr:MAG: hypothetical protein PQF12_gp18 [Streptococcus phage VS-2018a]AZA24388.1 MAG: hypothetical protein DF198_0090 [Streptococcus phage VS-2018a]